MNDDAQPYIQYALTIYLHFTEKTDLVKHNKDVQSHPPSYNYLFEKMRGRGYNSVTDLKKLFENIQLREKDQDLVTVTTVGTN